jgi:hypothetical protein
MRKSVTFTSLHVLIIEVDFKKLLKLTGSMGYLINALKSSYILVNYEAPKSVRYIDGQNYRKIYTIMTHKELMLWTILIFLVLLIG